MDPSTEAAREYAIKSQAARNKELDDRYQATVDARDASMRDRDRARDEGLARLQAGSSRQAATSSSSALADAIRDSFRPQSIAERRKAAAAAQKDARDRAIARAAAEVAAPRDPRTSAEKILNLDHHQGKV